MRGPIAPLFLTGRGLPVQPEQGFAFRFWEPTKPQIAHLGPSQRRPFCAVRPSHKGHTTATGPEPHASAVPKRRRNQQHKLHRWRASCKAPSGIDVTKLSIVRSLHRGHRQQSRTGDDRLEQEPCAEQPANQQPGHRKARCRSRPPHPGLRTLPPEGPHLLPHRAGQRPNRKRSGVRPGRSPGASASQPLPRGARISPSGTSDGTVVSPSLASPRFLQILPRRSPRRYRIASRDAASTATVAACRVARVRPRPCRFPSCPGFPTPARRDGQAVPAGKAALVTFSCPGQFRRPCTQSAIRAGSRRSRPIPASRPRRLKPPPVYASGDRAAGYPCPCPCPCPCQDRAAR